MGIISALGRVRQPAQQVCFLFPEPTGNPTTPPKREDTFVFQYWPQTLTDSDQTTYTEKLIPGGSHPLQQWVGGGVRNITFEAVFTAEVEAPADIRISQLRNTLTGSPSDRYTVDVSAAITSLRQFIYPRYRDAGQNTVVEPPKKLLLVFPGTNLNRIAGTAGQGDALLVILRSMQVNHESWFPSGKVRIATVSLDFAEVVQRGNGETSSVKFVDREDFRSLARRYDYRHGNYSGTTGA